MALWSELPNDLLFMIGEKLAIVADRSRFRSVCQSWRRSLPPFAQPPWLMLSEPLGPPPQPTPEPSDNEDDEEENEGKDVKEEEKENTPPPPPPPLRGFVGIGGGASEKQVVCEIEFPEAHQIRCVGSTGNWLITIDKSGFIALLNPFSRVRIDLPPQSKLEYGFAYEDGEEDEGYIAPQVRRDGLLKKAILSSTPSGINNNNCIAMVIHTFKYKLAIARPGDTSWTTVDTPYNVPYVDVIIYKEHFYAVNLFGMLVVCDIDITTNHALHPKATVVMERWLDFNLFRQVYLVEWMGELLLVLKFVQNLCKNMNKEERKGKQPPFYKTEKFNLYKLDFANKKWEELNSLGEYCLFLGTNTSVSILANACSLKKNCIYFTDNFTYGYRGNKIPGGLDMGVFDLEDNSISPHYKSISTCYYSPPLWIIPTSVMKCCEEGIRSHI